MKTRDWNHWIADQDKLIKLGQGEKVRLGLLNVHLADIPIEFRVRVYDLARRLHMSIYLLRSLQSEVRRMRDGIGRMDDQLLGMYALSLSRLGLFSEAEVLFQKALLSKDPLVVFFYGASLMSKWDYHSALKVFRQYLRSSSLPRYQRQVGKLNLAACLVFTSQFEKSVEKLEDFETVKNQYPLIYGNSLELKAQAYIFQKKWSQAEVLLNYAQAQLDKHPTYKYWVKKWQFILLGFRGKLVEKDWVDFQKEMESKEFFEIARDLFYYKAILKKSVKEIDYVYWGTPYSSYRDKILMNKFYQPKLNYILQVESDDGSDCFVDIYLESQVLSTAGKFIKIPLSIQRLVCGLTSDFFRPISLGELFNFLYPGDYFDVYTSPDRIAKSVQAARRFFDQNHLPLEIEVKHKRFSLKLQSGCRIHLYQKGQAPSLVTQWMNIRKKPFFSRKDLQKDFDISSDKASLWIRKSIELKEIRIEGSGRHIVYHLLKKQNNS